MSSRALRAAELALACATLATSSSPRTSTWLVATQSSIAARWTSSPGPAASSSAAVALMVEPFM